MTRRLIVTVAFGMLAACTSGDVTIPNSAGVTEVPSSSVPTTGTASSFGGEPLPEGVAIAPPGVTTADAAPGIGRPLDTDRLNLLQTTLEEQKIDAAVAERKLAADRAQLVIVQPGRLPDRVEGVNIALYAQQSTNAVGESVYPRNSVRIGMGSCGRFSNMDDAQRAFLTNGGPQADPLGIDPDGDGFACTWDPSPYRALRT